MVRWRARAEAPADPGVVPLGEAFFSGGAVHGGEAPGSSESTASQAPVVVGVHLGDCGIQLQGCLGWEGLIIRA